VKIKKYITQIWPYSYLTYDEKLNAITRFIILITLLGYVLLNRFIIVVLGLIVVGSIVLLYKKKEGLLFPYYGVNDQQEIEQNNPFGNVMMSDYKYNPNKKAYIIIPYIDYNNWNNNSKNNNNNNINDMRSTASSTRFVQPLRFV
jgi:hypothetical protein